MENTNRSIFALNGLTGMLIAIILLLSILCTLTYFGIMIQKDVATKPYTIENKENIKAKSVDNAKHIKIKE